MSKDKSNKDQRKYMDCTSGNFYKMMESQVVTIKIPIRKKNYRKLRLKAWWIRLRLMWRHRKIGMVNFKVIDLNSMYCDKDYYYCNGARVYDRNNNKLIKNDNR